MRKIALIFSTITIAIHVFVFAIEAFFLDFPAIAERIVEKNAAAPNVSQGDQIAILGTLFLNQAFYNLFLAVGGVVGLGLILRKHINQGVTLLIYICSFAVAAGAVLAATTSAYLAATIQAGPPLIALVAFYLDSSRTQRS